MQSWLYHNNDNNNNNNEDTTNTTTTTTNNTNNDNDNDNIHQALEPPKFGVVSKASPPSLAWFKHNILFAVPFVYFAR